MPAPSRPLPRTDLDFVELICADDELVRAEFAAIVAAEWGSPPPRRPIRPTPGNGPRHPGRRTAVDGRALLLPRRTRRPASSHRRQRSPPGSQTSSSTDPEGR
jgi:hypothetical protein